MGEEKEEVGTGSQEQLLDPPVVPPLTISSLIILILSGQEVVSSNQNVRLFTLRQSEKNLIAGFSDKRS